MSEPQRKADWTTYGTLGVLGSLLAALVLYISGYYALGTPVLSLNGGLMLRVYPAQWQVTVFSPAAKLESVLRGIDIEAEVEQ